VFVESTKGSPRKVEESTEAKDADPKKEDDLNPKILKINKLTPNLAVGQR
jgi:hypothetical protein